MAQKRKKIRTFACFNECRDTDVILNRFEQYGGATMGLLYRFFRWVSNVGFSLSFYVEGPTGVEIE